MKQKLLLLLSLSLAGSLAFAQAPATKDTAAPTTTNQADLHPDEGPPKHKAKKAKKSKAHASASTTDAPPADMK